MADSPFASGAVEIGIPHCIGGFRVCFMDFFRKLARRVKYASFSILDGFLLAGEIPSAKTKLVQAWIEIHREALLADWELAVNGETPFPIDPLR